MKTPYRARKTMAEQAQAIVEFAIVLMILMMLLVGILEVGRMLFIYAAVNNASREAARYGSAIGLDESGYPKYQNCDGIRAMARRSAFFTPLTIRIAYDSGPGSTEFDECTGAVDPLVSVNFDSTPDRVVVEVSANYSPLINLVPLSARTFTSSSARTILGYVEVESGAISAPPTSGLPNTATSVPATPVTIVPSDTATLVLASNTPTATLPPGVDTLTPLPTSTETLTPTITSTPTITFTPTETLTPTMTFTPTPTPTAVPGCDQLSASILYAWINSNAMNITITNPHDVLTVLDVRVKWNAATGGPGSKTLTLQRAELGVVPFWSGTNTSGDLTITPAGLTLPGNNVTTTLRFTFDKNYQNQTIDSTLISISFSTPGCENSTITRTK